MISINPPLVHLGFSSLMTREKSEPVYLALRQKILFL
jgi:hypothetical protein